MRQEDELIEDDGAFQGRIPAPRGEDRSRILVRGNHGCFTILCVSLSHWYVSSNYFKIRILFRASSRLLFVFVLRHASPKPSWPVIEATRKSDGLINSGMTGVKKI